MRSNTLGFGWRVALAVLLCGGLASAAEKPKRAEVKQAVVNFSGLPLGKKAMAAIVLDIKDGFHAQSHKPLDPLLIKFAVKMDDNPALTFGEPIYPEPEIKEYAALGKLSVYTGKIVLYVPVEAKADAKPGATKISGKLRYQICDEKVCYPPEQPKFEIATEIMPANADVKPNEP